MVAYACPRFICDLAVARVSGRSVNRLDAAELPVSAASTC